MIKALEYFLHATCVLVPYTKTVMQAEYIVLAQAIEVVIFLAKIGIACGPLVLGRFVSALA
jgi:hypothetical protein